MRALAAAIALLAATGAAPAAEMAAMFGYFQAHTYLGSDSHDQIALVFRLIHLHPTARLARAFFARWRLRMMDLADAVHMKGFGWAFR